MLHTQSVRPITTYLTLLFIALFGSFAFAGLKNLQQPTATVVDEALAQLEISSDGQTMTIRGTAPNSLKLCVQPARGIFGPTRCFTVGAVRRGEELHRVGTH